MGSWLVVDFMQERDRITAERSWLAINKSQLMNRSFGDTFLAADYLLRDVLGKNPQTTVVVIDEVDTDNWGIGGESVTRRRLRGS